MTPSLRAVIGAEALAAFETPGPVARGLPSTAYTSEAFFALENERIFPDSWVLAGFAHELDRAGAAPSFDDFVAPIERRLDGLDLAGIRHVVTIDLGEVAANWKLLMENFIEPYHVQFVHSTTTEQPLTDHYSVNESNCLGNAVDVSGTASSTRGRTDGGRPRAASPASTVE